MSCCYISRLGHRDTETKSSVSKTVAFKVSVGSSCPFSSSSAVSISLSLSLALCVWVHSFPQGVVSNREELISKVVLAPYGSGIRGVGPRKKQKRDGKRRLEERRRKGEKRRNVKERNYFGVKYCHIAAGQRGQMKGEEEGEEGGGVNARERRRRRGLQKANTL